MYSLAADTPQIHTELPTLEGRTAVIAGGTFGCGRAIAALLAAYGVNVLIFGRRAEELHDAISELEHARGRAYGIVADQSRPEDVRRIFTEVDRRLGHLDILINNADTAANDEASDADWRASLSTSLFGYIDCTGRAVDRMKRQGSGHIINLDAAIAGGTSRGEVLGLAAKGAIHRFSEGLRDEVAHDGIKVSVIESSGVRSSGSRPPIEAPGEQGVLRPEDVAVAVYYCLTQPARCSVTHLQLQPLAPH